MHLSSAQSKVMVCGVTEGGVLFFCIISLAGIGGGAERVRSTGREGKPRKARNKGPPAIFTYMFFAKTCGLLQKQVTPPPWCCLFDN